ncbi:unnamed protein product, partial [Iphiclides podalirius]
MVPMYPIVNHRQQDLDGFLPARDPRAAWNPIAFRPQPMAPAQQGYGDYPLMHSNIQPKSNPTLTDDNMLTLKMSMSQFSIDDIKVHKLGHSVFVNAQHGERKETRCFVSRGISRRFTLPKAADVEKLEAIYTLHGWLLLRAPLDPTAPEADKVLKNEPTPTEEAPEGAGATDVPKRTSVYIRRVC